MAAGSHDPGEFAEARRWVGYVLDRFRAARDIEARIIERQLVSIRYEVLYPPPRGIQRSRVGNVPLVEVTSDKVRRKLAELAVDIPFAATNVDHTLDLRFAPYAIQVKYVDGEPVAVGDFFNFYTGEPVTTN